MVLAVDFTRGPLLPLRLSIVNHWTSVTTCSSRHSSLPRAQNHFIWINVWSQPVREQSRQHWQARTNQPGEELITVITSELCQPDQSWRENINHNRRGGNIYLQVASRFSNCPNLPETRATKNVFDELTFVLYQLYIWGSYLLSGRFIVNYDLHIVMSVPWWQTDSVGANTHIRTYTGSWPQHGAMASLSQVRWEDSSQLESSRRTNGLAEMKPFLLKLFSWYRRAEHSGVTFLRIISDITGPDKASPGCHNYHWNGSVACWLVSLSF